MIDEHITLNCMMPTDEMKFRCSTEITEKILREVLRLSCYIPQFLDLVKEELNNKNDNFSYSRSANIVPCQALFELIEEPKFWRNLRKLANGYETCVNIHLVKICLYLHYTKKVPISLLASYFSTYVSLDNESMQKGVSQNVNFLFRSLELTSRYLPKNLITLWLSHNKDCLAESRTLTPDEYLVLASNSFDKLKLIEEKIHTVKINNKKDPETGVFFIEDVSKKPDFDFKLDQFTMSLRPDQIDYDYTYKKNQNSNEKNPQGRKKMIRMLETKSLKDFKGYLKDPELMTKLRETLNDGSHLLSKTKINSENFSYLQFRDSTKYIDEVASIIKNHKNESGTTFKHRPDTASSSRFFKTRPQTSRTDAFRPQSGISIRDKVQRPMTSVARLKKPNALCVGVKSEPYHVMTLRESVSLNYLK